MIMQLSCFPPYMIFYDEFGPIAAISKLSLEMLIVTTVSKIFMILSFGHEQLHVNCFRSLVMIVSKKMLKLRHYVINDFSG